jgi:hypothetical protein
MVTGLTGSTAGVPFLSFRWMNLLYALIFHSIKLNEITTTPFTAAQPVDFEVKKASAFSASDSAGSVIVPTPKKTGFPVMGAAPAQFVAGTDYDLRITAGSGAGGLTVGTRTLATDPLALRGVLSSVGVPIDPIQFDVEHEGVLVLMPAQSAALAEGLVINLITALGAAGVINFYVELAFSIVPPGALGF